ncbi:MAG: hypothetical protein V1720_05805 [bacterium]
MLPIWMIISLFDVLVWILPIFKQYRTDYFLFFLVLGISDVIAVILAFVFHLQTVNIYPVTTLLLMVVLLNNRKSTVVLLLVITGYFLTIIFGKIHYMTIYVINAILVFIVLLLLIRELYNKIVTRRILNWFLFVLVIYFTSNVVKILAFLINPSSPGLIQMIVTTFLQIGFGIFFCFATVENTNWKLKPKLPEHRIDNNELG